MSDDDREVFDWRLMQQAAHERQRRRSPPAAKQAPAQRRAQTISFPLGRRRAFVARLAAQVAARPTDAGELHLLQQLDRQRDVLARKGVPKQAIERELRALAAAVRAELWRLLLGGGA